MNNSLPVEPRVSLLMPNRDNARILDHVLTRLAMNTSYRNVELVAVDDGSTDGSVEILRRWRDSGRFRGFNLIERPHSGVVETLNAGLQAASGELVVQLDADASIETPDWLQKMLGLFCSDDRIGVVTAKVVFDWGEIHACGIDIVGPDGFHDRGTEVAEPRGRRTYHQRVFRIPEDAPGACDHVAEVDAGIGCCMMYRRDVALELGGYDSGFAPVWFDDLDLALSMRRHGLKVFYLPDVRVVHHLSVRAEPAATATTKQRLASAARRRLGALVPPRPRQRVVQALGLDRPSPEHRQRLEHHYAYWREKWGFDMLNPDMQAVRERWGDTEVCWATNPDMRRAGEEIVAAHAAGGSQREAAAALAYFQRYGFMPPPRWASLMSYEHILDAIIEHELHGLGGDFLEIGVLAGGGVYQLSKLLARHAPEQRVYAVDIFAPGIDATSCAGGHTMAEIYAGALQGQDQRELYDAVTADCDNLVTLAADSAEVELPTDALAFAHIDGNHDPEYVRGDFELVWGRLVPGGVVAFDDYGHDLPEVTAAVDALREEHAPEIGDVWLGGAKTLFMQRRR